MSQAETVSTSVRAPVPPSPEQMHAAPDVALAYIESFTAEVLTVSRVQQRKPTVSLKDYMTIYSAIHDFCTCLRASKAGHARGRSHSDVHLFGGTVYYALEGLVRKHCREILLLITRVSQRDACSSAAAREALSVYLAQWTTFLEVASWIAHLFRVVDRHWALREMDEAGSAPEETSRLVVPLHELQTLIWKEEILGCYTDRSSFRQVSRGSRKVMDAVMRLRQQGSAEDDAVIGDVIASFTLLGVDTADIM